MSGPKIDYAEIERQKKAALECERQKRLEEVKKAAEDCNQVKQKIRQSYNQINSDHQSLIDSVSQFSEMAFTIQEIQTIKKDFSNQLLSLVQSPLPADPTKIRQLSCDIEAKYIILQKDYNEKTSKEFHRVEDFLSSLQQKTNLEAFSRTMSEYSNTNKTISTNFDFDTGIINAPVTIDSETHINTTLNEIEEFINSDNIPGDLQDIVMGFAKNINESKGQDDSAINAALMEFDIAKSLIQQRISDFENQYMEYTAEYIIYIDELNSFRKQKIAITPKGRNMFRTIDQLNNELITLKKISRQTNEQNYIRGQIDEVMKLFGYDLCQDIILDPDQKGQHFLCPQKKGKTAIHIHLSDSDQIMMEIVNTGNKRVEQPDGVSAVLSNIADDDSSEKQELLAEQGRFCSIHQGMTDELRKRGVILKPKVHHGPGLKYCNSIINLVADEAVEFMVKDECEILNSPCAKRQKRTEPKVKKLSLKG